MGKAITVEELRLWFDKAFQFRYYQSSAIEDLYADLGLAIDGNKNDVGKIKTFEVKEQKDESYDKKMG